MPDPELAGTLSKGFITNHLVTEFLASAANLVRCRKQLTASKALAAASLTENPDETRICNLRDCSGRSVGRLRDLCDPRWNRRGCDHSGWYPDLVRRLLWPGLFRLLGLGRIFPLSGRGEWPVAGR